MKGKILDYIAWTLLVVSIILLKLTSNFVENLVSGKRFALEMAGVGLVFASLWMFLLYKLKPSYFKGGEKRASAVLSQFFSIVILTIFLSTFYNYKTGIKNLSRVKAIVLTKSTNAYKGTTYVTLYIRNKKERFNPRGNEYKILKVGDTINVLVGRGALNWEFIYKFQETAD